MKDIYSSTTFQDFDCLDTSTSTRMPTVDPATRMPTVDPSNLTGRMSVTKKAMNGPPQGSKIVRDIEQLFNWQHSNDLSNLHSRPSLGTLHLL